MNEKNDAVITCLPVNDWRMAMQWHDLLFMHWPVPVEVMRRVVPPALETETFDGQAWIGVVPLLMAGVRARGLPPLPGLSRFPELNVRTYVRVGGVPGVYFFSLDAHNAVAVAVARRTYRLMYYRAAMSIERADDWYVYRSRRTHRGARPAMFEGRYRPVGEPCRSAPGSLDHFLTERYYLYTTDAHGRAYFAPISHDPWALQPAEARIDVNTMTEPLGIRLPDVEPLLHFSKRVDVVSGGLKPAGGTNSTG